jgi:hypothetical protein
LPYPGTSTIQTWSTFALIFSSRFWSADGHVMQTLELDVCWRRKRRTEAVSHSAGAHGKQRFFFPRLCPADLCLLIFVDACGVSSRPVQYSFGQWTLFDLCLCSWKSRGTWQGHLTSPAIRWTCTILVCFLLPPWTEPVSRFLFEQFWSKEAGQDHTKNHVQRFVRMQIWEQIYLIWLCCLLSSQLQPRAALFALRISYLEERSAVLVFLDALWSSKRGNRGFTPKDTPCCCTPFTNYLAPSFITVL